MPELELGWGWIAVDVILLLAGLALVFDAVELPIDRLKGLEKFVGWPILVLGILLALYIGYIEIG